MVTEQKGEILRCSRCNYTWSPRRGKTPQRCPRCRSIKWNMPFLNLTCKRCGYSWSSHNGNPKRCPQCGTHHWDTEPWVFTCKRCGNSWVAKGNSVPKRCPACSSREWDKDEQDLRANGGCRRRFSVSDEQYESILENYQKGLTCVDIAVRFNIPYSKVYAAVRESIPNKEIRI